MKRLILIVIILLATLSWANTPPTISQTACVASGVGTARATASVTWANGDIVGWGGTSEGATTNEAFTAPTATGLTFTQQANINAGSPAAHPAGAMYTAVAGSASSGAITGHFSNGTSTWNECVWVWHNHNGVGNVSFTATPSATKTVALTPAGGADSGIMWVVGDWAGGTVTPTASPTSPNEITRQATGTAGYNYLSADISDQTSSGSVNYGITTTTTGPFTIIAVEIKGTPSVPSGTPSSKIRKLQAFGLFDVFPTGGSSGAGPVTITPLTADVFVPMTGQTVGNALTGTILTNGTVGTFGSWTVSGTGGKVGAHQAYSLPCSYTVNGTTYNSSTSTLSLDYINNVTTTFSDITPPSPPTSPLERGYIYIGACGASTGSHLWDLVQNVGGTTGALVELQLADPSVNGNYVLRAETTGGATNRTADTPVNSCGAGYWYELKPDYSGGTTQLRIYDPANGYALVNTTTGACTGVSQQCITQATGETISDVRIGNNESGTSGTTHNFFEDLLITWSGGAITESPATCLP